MTLLLVLACLFQFVQATSINSTSSSCPPPPDDRPTRSIWSILGSCALTLLICVWQASHYGAPSLQKSDAHVLQPLFKVFVALGCFLLPELIVSAASRGWNVARRRVKDFRAQGYKWSMTHSRFAETGGFVYCDGENSFKKIDSLEFLRLCREKKIANPVIAERGILDKSKSDALGKAILGLQLTWFILQVAVRHFSGLAITLVELDTVCMAVLTIILLFFWWHKPLRCDYPHIFYSKEFLRGDPDFELSRAWKSEPCWLYEFVDFIRKVQSKDDEEIHLMATDDKQDGSSGNKNQRRRFREIWSEFTKGDDGSIALVSLCLTWFIFGGLHLAAWNFPFLTEEKKLAWRIASLILTGAPTIVIITKGFVELRKVDMRDSIESQFVTLALYCALVSRLALIFLMVDSLRSIPCSAYQTIPTFLISRLSHSLTLPWCI